MFWEKWKIALFIFPGPIFLNEEIGTLSKDNDDRSENIGKKKNLCSFKLNRFYLDTLNMSKVGDFSWSWILKDFIEVQKQEGKFVVLCSLHVTSPIKWQIRRFHAEVVQWTSRISDTLRSLSTIVSL